MSEPVKILYSDDALVVAVKPCGVLSQPDKTGEPAVTDLLAAQLVRPVFPIHRLDRAVGGVMVFALDKRAAAKLSASVAAGSFEKEYLTVLHSVPPERGTWTDFLFHDSRKNITIVAEPSQKDAKPASLAFNVIETQEWNGELFSLVRVALHTGRTHQIRVQVSSRGFPIAGDGKYGAHDRCPMALWSWRLSFFHPVRKKRLCFTEPPIHTEPWTLFSFDF